MKQPDAWAQFAQNILTTGKRPHFAPSDEILAIVRERLATFVAERGRSCLAVILGATPELADIALTAGCRVVRIDSNPAMFEAAARRQVVADRNQETLIIGDWLHMHEIRDDEADIVLGDSSLNNVPHEDMPRLFAELVRITRPGSVLAFRQILLAEQPNPDYDFTPALAAFREASITADDFHRRLRFYAFTTNAYDPAIRVLDARQVFAEIRRKCEEGALNKNEFDFLMTRYSEIRHTIYGLAEQRRLLETLGNCEIISGGLADSARDLFKVFVIRVGQERP
jgi:ubiquinone/menaquinone biosynthesis C-methylase UbiE